MVSVVLTVIRNEKLLGLWRGVAPVGSQSIVNFPFFFFFHPSSDLAQLWCFLANPVSVQNCAWDWSLFLFAALVSIKSWVRPLQPVNPSHYLDLPPHLYLLDLSTGALTRAL